jgi:hypothetical protein
MSKEESYPMTRGELNLGEPHPAAYDAQKFIASLGASEISMWLESFASCAIENNRLAEVCSETLNRLLNSQPVSDRYILGLAFTIAHSRLDTDKEKLLQLAAGGKERPKPGADK